MSLAGKILKRSLQVFPYVKNLEDTISKYEKYIGFQPGHYYSPLVEPKEYIEQQKRPFFSPDFIPAEINFNEDKQWKILQGFVSYYSQMPFGETMSKGCRFSFDNDFFTYSDAITLYSMMRLYKPKNIIEIGSGFSSALILDTNEKFSDVDASITFIEPNPERLYLNLRENEKVNIIEQKVQDVDPAVFSMLQSGDFLLIDTSHVTKSGSDVNHIYFNILPYLNKGVKIHIHDIFFPFEYPEKWAVEEKRSWNEIFLLRSFMAFNNSFSIVFFNDYIQRKHIDFLQEKMPLFLKRKAGVCGGIWIEKTV